VLLAALPSLLAGLASHQNSQADGGVLAVAKIYNQWFKAVNRTLVTA
jgi:hypothetical protein